MKRFDHVIIGAAVQTFHDIVDAVLGGDDDNRYIIGLFLFAFYAPNGVQTGHTGQHKIHQHQIRLFLMEFFQAKFRVFSFDGGQVVFIQVLPDDHQHVAVIFDDQDFFSLFFRHLSSV